MSELLEIIKEIENLLWAIILLVAIYIVLKYYCMPTRQLKHERQMKDDAHEREKEWVHFNDIKACTDKQMQEKLQQLKKENKDLKNQLELEKVNQDLLDKQLKVYKAFMSALNLEIKPKAENSKKE